MKRQRPVQERSSETGFGSKRAWGLGVGALLALRFVACASDANPSNELGAGGSFGSGGSAGSIGTGGSAPVGPMCGNQVVEAGEACDGLVQVTCGTATMNTRPVGVVKCTACQFDVAGCTSAGTGGMSMPAGTGGGVVTGSSGAGTGTAGMPSGGALGAGGALGVGGTLGGSGGAAGSVSGGGSSGVLGDVDALRQACVDTINMYRATKNVAPLKLAAASVETCSDMGAQADATAGVAHGSAGKCPGMSAQDTCPGWPPKQYGGAEGALKSCLMSMWGEGEPPEGRDACLNEYFMGNIACFEKYGHYLNMSDPGNGTVSCGFYVMPNGSLWMNQDLGR